VDECKTLVFGLLHGLVLLPVLMSIAASTPYAEVSRCRFTVQIPVLKAPKVSALESNI
jgi:hypothetical protein